MAVVHRALCTWFVIQIFLILLVLRLDERTRWSWFIVFIPIWLHDAILCLTIMVKVITFCKGGCDRNRKSLVRSVWCLSLIILKLITQFLLCFKLDSVVANVPLYYVLIPLWLLLPLCTQSLARTMIGDL